MEALKPTYKLKVTYKSKSICQIIKPNSTVKEKTNYDPWGRVRDADTWQYPTSEAVAQSDASSCDMVIVF